MANANDINTSQSESGRAVSLGTGGMYIIPFKLTSNYMNISKYYLYIIVMIDISTTICSSPMTRR